jgi:hypothetical protein
MFRPELSDPARFPAADAAGGRAFAVLERLVGDLAGPRASRSRKDALLSMHWSLVHGLATLLLDGPLAAELGHGVARGRHVDDVLTLFLAR